MNDKTRYEVFKETLNDENSLRNIRTVVVLIAILSLGIIYLGFKSSFSLDALLNFTFGGLAAISAISIWITRVEIKDRAFNHTRLNNTDIITQEDKNKELNKQVTNDLWAQEYIDQYNKDNQEINDKEYTSYLTRKAEVKIRRMRLSKLPIIIQKLFFYNKQISILEKRVNLLNQHLQTRPWYHVRRKYVPIEYKDIVSLNAENTRIDRKGRAGHKANPKTNGLVKSFFGSFLKGFGLGGTGSLIFMIDTPLEVILRFYAFLIISLVITVLSEWIKTMKMTNEDYLIAITNIGSRLNEMVENQKKKQVEADKEKLEEEKRKAEEERKAKLAEQEKQRQEAIERRKQEQEDLRLQREHELELKRIEASAKPQEKIIIKESQNGSTKI